MPATVHVPDESIVRRVTKSLGRLFQKVCVAHVGDSVPVHGDLLARLVIESVQDNASILNAPLLHLLLSDC